MRTIDFLKAAALAGGFLYLCATPALTLGQANQPGAGAGAPAPMNSAPAPRGKSAAPPDLLEGLTLSDDQKAKIAQIHEDTKSRLAIMDGNRKLDPDTANAMRRGYERLQNGRILEVLTLEQQQQVRKRIAEWRASTGKPQYPLRRAPGSEQAPKP